MSLIYIELCRKADWGRMLNKLVLGTFILSFIGFTGCTPQKNSFAKKGGVSISPSTPAPKAAPSVFKINNGVLEIQGQNLNAIDGAKVTINGTQHNLVFLSRQTDKILLKKHKKSRNIR